MAIGTLSSNSSGDWVHLPFGKAAIILRGTFAGGQARLQIKSEDGSTAVDASTTTAAWSEAVTAAYDSGGSCEVRITLAGATSPSLIWEIKPLYNS